MEQTMRKTEGAPSLPTSDPRCSPGAWRQAARLASEASVPAKSRVATADTLCHPFVLLLRIYYILPHTATQALYLLFLNIPVSFRW